MSEVMKQRLVGAIVLGCLAIIFVPIILDGDGISTPDSVAIEVPINPVVPDTPDNLLSQEADSLTEPEQRQAENPEPELPAVSEPLVQDDSSTEVPANDVPTLDSDGLPQGWVVRLGAFADRANAEGLEERLLAAEQKAYIRPVSGNEGSLAGVYVGPVLTQADAEKLQQELMQTLDMEGVVEPFSIDD